MTAPLPAPGSPEEDALAAAAIDALARGKKLLPRRTGIHPAYEATRPAELSLSPRGALFKRAVTAAYLAHHDGHSITPTSLQIFDAGLPTESLVELLDAPLFHQALEDRGIPLTPATFLTEEQSVALATLADHSLRKSERVKLKMIGVSWERFQGWLAQPTFRRAYRDMQARTLKLATERGDTVLAQLIDDGNIRAIEYANAMTGKYDPAQREAASAMRILGMVMSVVQKRVTDEVTLIQLAEDFERLAAQGGLPQGEIMDAEIVPSTPEEAEPAD